MRRFLITLCFSVSLIMPAQASATLCSAFYAKRLKRQIDLPHRLDKWKHCALSCMLARRCGAEDSFLLGIIKELADMFGEGNAEWADLRADADGVTLWRLGLGASDLMCQENCASLYPEPLQENSCRVP